MSNDIAIRVENLSKIYRLYDRPVDRLKESIHPLRKKYHRDFYALKDVSFEVKKGETVGIIGKNGSGKSTLLKILTGVLTPSSGKVEVNGKVSALLELGAGFNPEFTGIENIYLNGTIMGYSKEEIDAKLDDILDFADIGDFVHQPVKMYSSGMFVRLAFAVQACIDPEILVVDEALAVGDAEFTFKCINHMKRLIAKGVTVLFVTHDVQIVRSFCQRVIWVDNGEINLNGQPHYVTSEYIRELFYKKEKDFLETQQISIREEVDTNKKEIKNKYTKWGSGEITIEKISLLDEFGNEIDVIEWGKQVIIRFTAKALSNVDCSNIGFGFSFRNKNGLDIIVSTTIEEGLMFGSLQQGDKVDVEFRLENILASGDYLLTLQVEDRTEKKPRYFIFIEDAKIFKVVSNKEFFSVVQPQIFQRVILNER